MRQIPDWPVALTASHLGEAKAVAQSLPMSDPASVHAAPPRPSSDRSVQCFIVAGHEGEREAIAGLARQNGYAVALATHLEMLKTQPAYSEAPRPLVLLLDTGQDGGQAEAAMRFAEDEAGRCYLVYIADTIAPDNYKRLLRTRNAEWCRRDELPRELAELAQRPVGADVTARGGARIVAFFPSKGGVGNTTLAIEAAMHLARLRKQSGGRIAILDLDLDGGTLADALDVQPRFEIHEIVGMPQRLDNQLIDIFTSRHSSGIDVFASPRRRSGAVDVDPQMIFAVLDLMADRYDLILLDIPNQRLPFVDNLLQGSDGVVVCGDCSVPALKQLAGKLGHLDSLSIDSAKLVVVVNQCETDVFGRIVRRVEISRALPGRQIVFVRRDMASVRDAGNAGRPLLELHPGSRVSKDMRTMAACIEETVAAHGAVRGPRS